ncbi:MAG: N-methyl-L-tryptophan oxidase [uncultured Thermomicrobiales bacterium]|uniref:N-methyl-L-tryptophan oxidase n=1 Tax=uncultured Thermomicrobiales bacterium TaxID=1645740 RepID=A0A6J4VPX1_9BACT|nr:MAG: N-methyl-L-tryptophan oxidase [uncultured Thermomicrobiales bacterium]
MKRAYEYVVVGVGGLGSAAAYRLAREAGSEVLALEQFRLGHDNGASQDHSRIIRLSYHDPAYTALTPHTYTAWAEVEEESGVQLVYKTGGLDLCEADTPYADVYAGAMRRAGIPFEEWTPREAMAAYPQLRLDDGHRILYQADTGLVDARKANQAHQLLARAHGATILEQTPVRGIRPTADGVEVETDLATFQARCLIVTADAWTNQVLAGAGVSWPLTVTQEQVTYFATPRVREFAPDRFPVWIWHGRDILYGFPVYGEVATKAGVDVGGDVVTPDVRTFEPNPRAHDRLIRFLERHIPGFTGPALYTKTCLYTMPPDRNFVVDVLAEHPRIIVAQGAGHAYKFAALLGKILCDLAVHGQTTYPIGAFTADRPAITDPGYPPSFRI